MLRVSKGPSNNSKLVHSRKSKMFASYREVGRTCPASCPFLDNGCYAQDGHVLAIQRGSSSEHDGEVKLREVIRLPEGAILRDHVSGDFFLDGRLDVEYLQATIEAARLRPDVTIFTYTHAWPYIDRALYDWPPNLALNASCDTLEDLTIARHAGWPTTIVVPSFFTGKLPVRSVVCPAQTVHLACLECRICMRGKRSATVIFLAHGNRVKRVNTRLAAAA